MVPEIITSKKTGERHLAARQGCQDHFSVRELGGAVILAVSDGHSSCCRSGMGSRIACRAFQTAAAEGRTADELPGAVKEIYDRLVRKHLRFRPLTEAERAAPGGQTPETAYGATLLGAVLEKERTLLYQLGDGCLMALRRDGTPFPAMEADPDCRQQFTSSLCYPFERALAHSRCAEYAEPCGALIAATDGYDFRGALPLPLLAALGDPAPLSETAAAVLADGENGDDQTAVLIREEGIAGLASFGAGVKALLTDSQRSRRIRALKREHAELRVYLANALAAAKRMKERGDPGLTRFLETVKRRAARYEELSRALASPDTE